MGQRKQRVKHVTGAKSAGAAPPEARGAGLGRSDEVPESFPGRRGARPGKKPTTFQPEPIPAVGEIPLEIADDRPYPARSAFVRDLAFICFHRGYGPSHGGPRLSAVRQSVDVSKALDSCIRRMGVFAGLDQRRLRAARMNWCIVLSGDTLRASVVAQAIIGRMPPPLPFVRWVPTRTRNPGDDVH